VRGKPEHPHPRTAQSRCQYAQSSLPIAVTSHIDGVGRALDHGITSHRGESGTWWHGPAQAVITDWISTNEKPCCTGLCGGDVVGTSRTRRQR
jgi:hypothetical protein